MSAIALTEAQAKELEELKEQQRAIKAEAARLELEASELRDRQREIGTRITELTVPFKVGDICQDEKGVQYRVTQLAGYGGHMVGIRLTKEGHEAHKDSRRIYSNKLVKVEVEAEKNE
jgi:regulator of replication initiation timing